MGSIAHSEQVVAPGTVLVASGFQDNVCHREAFRLALKKKSPDHALFTSTTSMQTKVLGDGGGYTVHSETNIKRLIMKVHDF